MKFTVPKPALVKLKQVRSELLRVAKVSDKDVKRLRSLRSRAATLEHELSDQPAAGEPARDAGYYQTLPGKKSELQAITSEIETLERQAENFAQEISLAMFPVRSVVKQAMTPFYAAYVKQVASALAPFHYSNRDMNQVASQTDAIGSLGQFINHCIGGATSADSVARALDIVDDLLAGQVPWKFNRDDCR